MTLRRSSNGRPSRKNDVSPVVIASVTASSKLSLADCRTSAISAAKDGRPSLRARGVSRLSTR